MCPFIFNTKLMQQSSASRGESSVIIMDEVDGMSSGDSGGVSELIHLIRDSKVICV